LDIVQNTDLVNRLLALKSKICIPCSSLTIYFFSFHEHSSNAMKKPYMITDCKHAFHTQCLEKWLMQKRECPSCRTIIKLDDNS